MARRDGHHSSDVTEEVAAAIAREVDALAADVAIYEARCHDAKERQRALTALLAQVTSTGDDPEAN